MNNLFPLYMKSCSIKFSCSFISFIFAIMVARSQNSVIDTIYTNERISVAVKFPSEILNFRTIPEPTHYQIRSLPEQKQLTVGTDSRNTGPEHIYILLKKRTLHFLIAYKKNIDFNDDRQTIYDYSSYDKIDAKMEAKNDDAPVATKSTGSVNNKGNGEAEDYHGIIEKGYQEFKQQHYEAALGYYEKAHKMRPEDVIVTDRINAVKEKLADKGKEEKKLQEAYKSYMATGDKFLKQNKLNEARLSYEQALVISKDDKTATRRIAEIDQQLAEDGKKEEQESNYKAAMLAGDRAFQKEDYENARVQYNKAIGFFNREEPRKQLKEIDKIAASKNEARLAEQKARTEKEETDRKEKEKQALQKKYYAALKNADKLFTDGEFEKARIAYNKSLEFAAGDKWPQEQLERIDKIKKEQEELEKTARKKEQVRLEKEKKENELKEIERKYNAAIEKADKLFDAENYNEARPAYKEALAIARKPWPQEQLKKIEKIEADIAEKAREEKLKIEKEKALAAKYQSIIRSADQEFSKKNYTAAAKFYQGALAVKENETYPKEKLKEILVAQEAIAAAEKARKERLAAEAEAKRRYDLAMSKAKSYMLKEEYENARTALQDALVAKPAEQEPRKQLDVVNAKLAEIVRLNAIEERYEAKRAIADSLVLIKQFEQAKPVYRELHEIKPTETYALSLIRYCDAELKEAAAQKAINDKAEAARKEEERENRFYELRKEAIALVSAGDFEAARKKYAEALEIRPDDSYCSWGKKMCSDQLAKKNTQPAGSTLVRNNADTKSHGEQEIVNAVPVKQTESPYELQVKPIPYTDEELKQKYPGIDFTKLPPEQPSNDEAVDTKENTRIFNEVLADKPRLTISDKNNKVKLICQSIYFEGDMAYFKFIIQNSSAEDFLTGAMMLNWERTTGTKIKLYPIYIYPNNLPIITPNREAVIIYACRAYNVGEKDKLKFELSDRKNKTRFELGIKGSVYRDEFARP